MPESLSRAQARRLFVHAQGLDGDWPPLVDSALPGPQAVARTVNRLGYVQLDTIAVVERAHHHTLWRRQPDYVPDDLHMAQAIHRTIFEALCPNASYLPMKDYRFTVPSMRASAEWWANNWRASEREDRDRVLARIRDEGPLGASNFEAPEGFVREGWWSWKPAKRTLEHLFVTGELMVSERRGFERVLDLRERVLPDGIDTACPTDEELGLFLARQALDAMGIAGDRNARWRPGKYRTALAEGLQRLAEEGEAIPVTVEAIARGSWYVRQEALEGADGPPATAVAQILSPFDSLVINRAWLKALWDFDYSIECYLPQAKRRYGYFCLPVLWRDRFVARVDLKADRKASSLLVRGLWLEPDAEEGEGLWPALAQALREFAAFNGCGTVSVEAIAPTKPRDMLSTALANAV